MIPRLRAQSPGKARRDNAVAVAVAAGAVAAEPMDHLRRPGEACRPIPSRPPSERGVKAVAPTATPKGLRAAAKAAAKAVESGRLRPTSEWPPTGRRSTI